MFCHDFYCSAIYQAEFILAETRPHPTDRPKPELKAKLSPTDRLVIKLFHPKDGIEMDAKYSIISNFQLPLEFRVSPYIVMDGTTRHEKYVIEVFTDKDQDVLGIADGELLGRTAGTVDLGTRGLQIILNLLRK